LRQTVELVFVGCFHRHSADMPSPLEWLEIQRKMLQETTSIFRLFSIKRPDHEHRENVRYCDPDSRDGLKRITQRHFFGRCSGLLRPINVGTSSVRGMAFAV
jgi:hypothetical protein